MMRNESGTTLSCVSLGDMDIRYVWRSMRLIPIRVRHFLLSDSMGVMKKKLDLLKPAGYPPRLSEIIGNRKKLNGPNQSGLRFFNTFGVVKTVNPNAFLKRRSHACLIQSGT